MSKCTSITSSRIIDSQSFLACPTSMLATGNCPMVPLDKYLTTLTAYKTIASCYAKPSKSSRLKQRTSTTSTRTLLKETLSTRLDRYPQSSELASGSSPWSNTWSYSSSQVMASKSTANKIYCTMNLTRERASTSCSEPKPN